MGDRSSSLRLYPSNYALYKYSLIKSRILALKSAAESRPGQNPNQALSESCGLAMTLHSDYAWTIESKTEQGLHLASSHCRSQSPHKRAIWPYHHRWNARNHYRATVSTDSGRWLLSASEVIQFFRRLHGVIQLWVEL